MDGIGKIEKSKESVADKRVLGALEGKAGYAMKANFTISTEELPGKDRKFQGLEKTGHKVPNIGKEGNEK